MSRRNAKKIEIWSTLGPSSINRKVIQRLEEVGVTMFRINLSHTPINDIENKVKEIQQFSSVPVCLDTEGPQIRTGRIRNNGIKLKHGQSVKIYKESGEGDEDGFHLRPRNAMTSLKLRDLVSIDFDSALITITGLHDWGAEAKVICEGVIGSNKAVTVDRKIHMPILTEKDYSGIEVINKLGLKSISLSFVNRADDVRLVRELVGPDVRIISKIETKQALENLEAIIELSDAILIDRGDLSREESIGKIPLLQKQIIKTANKMKTPVVVATNFLESMVKVKKPLRSEVNDIMNTLLDGADGLVLAAETAIGQYPAECGNMVRRMIKYFELAQDEYSLKELIKKDSMLLIEPHGGVLIDRFESSPQLGAIRQLPQLNINHLNLLDATQISIGAYSPLEGFLTQAELNTVLNDYKLPNGTVWTLPILLQVEEEDFQRLRDVNKIALVYEQDQQIYGTLDLQDTYEIDLNKVAQQWFGTTSIEHPGVKRLIDKGRFCFGGKITMIRLLDSKFKEFEFTPRQMRLIFEHKEWSKVAGFHTRNAIHRAHEYLQQTTFDRYNLDGLLLHPVVGPKKTQDFMPEVILESYKIMLNQFYSQEHYIFGVFNGYSHYAGPREAVFTALCRKNFGCSHFIIGRDHTGVKDFYSADDSKKLFEKLGDLGIQPIFYDTIYYCDQCKSYVEQCDHNAKFISHISGTQAREMFLAGEQPPDWFLRDEISTMISNRIKNGDDVFVQ